MSKNDRILLSITELLFNNIIKCSIEKLIDLKSCGCLAYSKWHGNSREQLDIVLDGEESSQFQGSHALIESKLLYRFNYHYNGKIWDYKTLKKHIGSIQKDVGKIGKIRPSEDISRFVLVYIVNYVLDKDHIDEEKWNSNSFRECLIGGRDWNSWDENKSWKKK